MVRAALGVLLGALALSCASTRQYTDLEFGYQVKSDFKEVGDVSYHYAGSFENTGVCVAHPGQKDETVGALSSVGTIDSVWTSPTSFRTCTLKGRTTCTFLDPDRSTRTYEWTAECKYTPYGTLTFEGHGVFVDGTGRYKGIQGTTSWTSWDTTFPLERSHENINYLVATGKYTLPGK
jgi:hypothetical protein